MSDVPDDEATLATTVLDLSRNKINSLDGIEKFANLVELSLYFNQISDEASIAHLAALSQLKRLDLRLNPVTRISDYRMYV